MRRLVLGCGALAHSVLDAFAARDGELLVIDPDTSRVETLRNEKIVAEQGDVTDPDVVRGAAPADFVFVGADDPAQNAAALEALREAIPGAYAVANVGEDATRALRARITDLGDRVIDPGDALLAAVADRADGDAAARGRALKRTIEGIDGTLGVLTHDNPDPDAIAAAAALAMVADSFDVDAEPCYFGNISHQENRAFINLLDIDLRRFDPDEGEDPTEAYEALALVDHSRPGVNDRLDPETEVCIVLDHHPSEEEVRAEFVDVQADVGATSTLLAEYVTQFDLAADRTVSTALLYGIRVDTRDFTRETSRADFEAAAELLPYADGEVLERVEAPSISADTFETIAGAIENRELSGSALASCVGRISDRDALAQAADQLLAMEGVAATMVYGYTDDTIYVSARSQGDVDLGAVLRVAFDGLGSAGGHAEMAGAQIPLGVFAEMADEEDLRSVVAGAVTPRFFEALRA